MLSVLGVRVYGVAGLQKPGRKTHAVDMALRWSPSSFPIIKVSICHAWSLRALHAASQECPPSLGPTALLPAIAKSSLECSQPKAALTQFSTAENTWEGQSWTAPVSDLPLLPLFWIIFVSKQVKIPPLSTEPQLWPEHHHHLGNQTNKWEERKMLHNYSEPPWKEGCYQNHWVSFIEDFLLQENAA